MTQIEIKATTSKRLTLYFENTIRKWIDNKSCFGIDYLVDLNKLAELIMGIRSFRVKSPKILTWDEVVQQLNTLYKEVLS